MKKKQKKSIQNNFLFLFVGMLCSTYCCATPARDINLLYSFENQNLSIKARHVSRDLNEHYIRKIDVFLNDKKIESLYPHRQNSPRSFQLNVGFQAQEGDNIRIKLICSKGGVKSAEITLEPEEKE